MIYTIYLFKKIIFIFFTIFTIFLSVYLYICRKIKASSVKCRLVYKYTYLAWIHTSLYSPDDALIERNI